MIYSFLVDSEEGTVDGVIISEHTTADKIEKCIQQMKDATGYDWQWDDLLNCLPNDCKLIDRWDDSFSGKVMY